MDEKQILTEFCHYFLKPLILKKIEIQREPFEGHYHKYLVRPSSVNAASYFLKKIFLEYQLFVYVFLPEIFTV